MFLKHAPSMSLLHSTAVDDDNDNNSFQNITAIVDNSLLTLSELPTKRLLASPPRELSVHRTKDTQTRKFRLVSLCLGNH